MTTKPQAAARWAVVGACVVLHFAVAARIVPLGLPGQLLLVGAIVAGVQQWWGPATLPLSIGRLGPSLRLTLKVTAVGVVLIALFLGGVLAATRGLGLHWPLRTPNFVLPEQFDDYLVVSMVWAPLIEELFYRGLVQARLVDLTGRLRGLLLSALVFWVYHWVALGVVSVTHLAAGILFAWVYDRTRSLLAPLLLHALANLLLGLYNLALVVYPADIDHILHG